MSLQNTVRTHNDLTELTKSIRSTISLNILSALIGGFVTDDSLKATLDKVVGKKGSKTIKQSDAEVIAANMLGFKNTNAMFAHYKNVKFFTGLQYLHIHRHGDDNCVIWAREDSFLTTADVIAFDFIDGTQTRSDERIEQTGELGSKLVEAEIKDDAVFNTDNVAAVVLIPNESTAKIERYQKTLFNQTDKNISERVFTLVDIFDEAEGAFVYSENRFLKSLDGADVEYPIAEQSDFESVSSLLCWVVESLSCGRTDDIPDGLTQKTGQMSLTGGYTLDYDIRQKVFGLSKDGNLVKALGFTTYDKDHRMDKYHQITEYSFDLSKVRGAKA